ncbi:MAG: Na+:solute symporter [Deltaproteobacteria bacterium]|nr:Na+:solute symporter [Deltaproteobacteria bacterium]
MAALDWGIVALYFLVVAGVGARFAKRAGRSLEEYFAAGRSAPWWLAGAGMIATTFAADTPLVVTGLVAAHGVSGNWLWWCMVMSGILTVFLTARLWHRAGVLSDVELVELRYGGAPARFLRGFRALFLALPINLIILGWVNLAMVKVLRVMLGIDAWMAMLACFAVTVVYSTAGGLHAALWVDLVQLVLMMAAVIVLAIFCVDRVGGIDALLDGVTRSFGSREAAVGFLPVGEASAAWLPPLALFTFLAVQWWAAWYPGAEPGGGGYVAQRIFSTRSEKDGVLAVLFFQVGHYALRPWPWIITGLCTVLMYPGGITLDGKPDVEAAYVQAIVDVLPMGLKGFLLAGFLAAYMSTVSTHLNWGASYLVNDLYKRFVAPKAEERSLVRVSRLCTVGIFLLSIAVTSQMGSIAGAWKFLLALGAGTGMVLILRFVWWRINATSEIAAMVASVVTSLIAWRLFPSPEGGGAGELEAQAKVMLVVVAVSTAVWLAATFLTRAEDDAVLRRFLERVRPEGPGWAAVYRRLALPAPPPRGREVLLGFVLGVVLVYASLFGLGKLVLAEPLVGVGLLALAVVAWLVILRVLPRLLSTSDAAASTPKKEPP